MSTEKTLSNIDQKNLTSVDQKTTLIDIFERI